MPTIEVLFDDLQRLVGRELPREANELNDILSLAKGEVESLEGEELSIEVKDGNRPDLWSVEGIARQLRGALEIDKEPREYSIEGLSDIEVKVDPRLKNIRPYISCALIKNIQLNDEIIREFMHLQDKLDQTYGRRRKKTSIGLYNYKLLEPPIQYTVAKPNEISFVPLDSNQKMSLKEILATHPKGLEFGHIVKPYEYWPILYDSKKHILSFPPIINSNDLGKITEEVKDIFIEVTGTSYTTVLNTLMIVALSASDRGGKIFSTKIFYPYIEKSIDVTPKIENNNITLNIKYINQVLGLDLNEETVLKLLKQAGYKANQKNSMIKVIIPCYRLDVMHQVDVIEDIAIMFGYNNISPHWPQLITFGNLNNSSSYYNLVREIMIGLGFQEILTFTMTDKETLFNKMNLKPHRIIDVSNPMTSRYSCMRNWLMPSLMEFLSNNLHVNYPQKVFEVGDCITFDRENKTKVRESKNLACLISSSDANFNEVKSILDAVFLNLGISYELKEIPHKSFIDGRVGSITSYGNEIGIIGEINPKVIENWKMSNPVSGFELDLSRILLKK